MKYYIMLSVLYLSSVLYAQCDTCRIRVDGTFAGTSVPVDSLYAALRDRYHNLVVDTDEVYPESSEVYGILLGTYYSDSVLERFKEFVYNGGTLLIFGETCLGIYGWRRVIEFFGPDLGFSYHPTTVVDSVDAFMSIEGAIYRGFANHPLIRGLPDSVWLDRGGSIGIKQNSKARKLVWGGPTAYALDCDSCGPYTPPEDWVIWETAPTLVAMSSYGEGIVIYHADYSDFALYYEYSYLRVYSNLDLVISLFNCSLFPKFEIEPPKNDSIPLNDTLFISTTITNYGAIDPDSLSISVDGTEYDISSPLISVIDSSFTFSLPLETYSAGDTIFFCIETICDTGCYWYYDSICWSYIVYEDTTDIIDETDMPSIIEISAYPNPFNSSCNISVETHDYASLPAIIEIYDLQGNVVGSRCASTDIAADTETGDASIAPTRTFIWTPDETIPSGIYLVKARTADGNFTTKRIFYLK